MYKSKLQELCQKQKWGLPKYTCIKYGEDHCPHFTASVAVSGITFRNPAVCRSSKQALNDAAHLAFLHFTSQPSNQSEYVEKTSNDEREVQSYKLLDYMAMKQYSQEAFETKLKIYAERKNLDMPAYHTEKEGLHFNARVSVGEDWFESRELCDTAEEAEDSAADAALLSLSIDAFHEENDPRSYKALLQELADNEGFFPPTYTTIRSNESHCHTFSSIVEVEGEVFQGATATTKKLAELNAAKAAYTAFIERKIFQPGYFSPKPSGDEILKLVRRLGSATISDPQQNPTYASPSNFTSSTKHKIQEQDTMGENLETDKVRENSNADNNMKKATELKSYLLCNRVRVFTCIPNMALPKGTVVLPISEDKWTVVTLEFTNEKGV